MPRYKLIVEYDGTGFVGWQRQTNGRSVQEAIEQAVEGFSGEKTRLSGAGRTDAGVHALGQCAHLDLAQSFPPDTVRDALNAHLRGEPISILSAEQVGRDFDARTSAKTRVYLYRIVNRRGPLALERNKAWQVAQPLDADAMQEAAQALVGHHDFSTFRASGCQARSPVKTLEALEVARRGDEVRIIAKSRSFVQSQVRAMVGTLALVGEGKWSAEDVAEALKARERGRGGPTAPAQGLYLVEVIY